ncbi:hypothetical protein HK096_004875, partial [Nowakowskiella sp. JEL0078]
MADIIQRSLSRKKTPLNKCFTFIWNDQPDKLNAYLNDDSKLQKVYKSRDGLDATVLHIAILNNKANMVLSILKKIPKLVWIPYGKMVSNDLFPWCSGVMYTGETAMHLAVVIGNLEIIRYLCQAAICTFDQSDNLENWDFLVKPTVDFKLSDDDIIRDTFSKKKITTKFIDNPLAIEKKVGGDYVGRAFRKQGDVRDDEKRDDIYQSNVEKKLTHGEGYLPYG